MSETYTPQRPPAPPGVVPSQPAYYQAPPLQEQQPMAQPQTSKTMRIWGWILTIFGALVTVGYIVLLISALVNGLAIRSRFVVQIVIAVAILVVGVVLMVRSKRKVPQYG